MTKGPYESSEFDATMTHREALELRDAAYATGVLDEQRRAAGLDPGEDRRCVIARCDGTVEPGQSFYCTIHAIGYGRQGASDA